jgi:hypothetical protein
MLRVALLAALVVLGAVAVSPLTPTATARPTCDFIHYLPGDPDSAVSCIKQDLPCLPRPCG